MWEWICAGAVPMTPPQAYGAFHLAFFFGGLICVAAIAFLCARFCSERQGVWILFSVGVLLAVGEGYKQLFYTAYYGNGSYQWHMFPFQLCSMPMYLCLLLPFLRKKEHRRAVLCFLSSFGLMGGFVSYLSPQTMCRNTWNMTLHSFLWHMLLILIGVCAGILLCKESKSRARRLRMRTYLAAVGQYVGFAVIAFGINCLCYSAIGYDGTLTNMFYVGPHDSPLVICRDICASAGWGLNTVVYMSALIACAFLFFLVFWLVSLWQSKQTRPHSQSPAE